MIQIDLSGSVALITGASSGIGMAMAKTFQATGATVVGADLKKPSETVGRWINTDVSIFESVEHCIADILRVEQKIDFLINNAGVSRDAPIWKMTEENWDLVVDTNLKGAFNMIHFVAPHFRERKTGKIVNISSINGLRGKFGLANYSAAKAGLVGLTKTVAKELARYNVNVNAVAPGLIDTPLSQQMSPEVLEKAKSEILFDRIGTPEDVANTVIFLCSPLAQHITGNVISVDGGQLV